MSPHKIPGWLKIITSQLIKLPSTKIDILGKYMNRLMLNAYYRHHHWWFTNISTITSVCDVVTLLCNRKLLIVHCGWWI